MELLGDLDVLQFPNGAFGVDNTDGDRSHVGKNEPYPPYKAPDRITEYISTMMSHSPS